MRLPSLNVPLSKGSRGIFWGRPSPFALPLGQAIEFRRRLIAEVLHGFGPDVIIVENRPLGMMEELDGLLQESCAAKIFLTRGIMSKADQVRSHYLTPRQELVLSDGTFVKAIVAGDKKVWDLAAEYDLSSEIATRLEYVGYFSEPVSRELIERARVERGVGPDDKWIVCSAGGGVLGERNVEEFTRLLDKFPRAVIDVVHGPQSSLPWGSLLASSVQQGRLRLHRECTSLSLLHAAADLVISPGGYNSLVEAMEGGAPIIVMPVQPDGHDEQYLHASRLAAHYPIRISTQPAELIHLAADALEARTPRLTIRDRATLKFDGLESASDLIVGLCRPAIITSDRASAETGS